MDWALLEKNFKTHFLVWALLGGLVVGLLFQPIILVPYLVGLVVMAVEFWLLILLCSALLGLKKLGILGLNLVVLGKFGIWGAVLSAPLWAGTGYSRGFAIGCGIFVIALLTSSVQAALEHRPGPPPENGSGQNS